MLFLSLLADHALWRNTSHGNTLKLICCTFVSKSQRAIRDYGATLLCPRWHRPLPVEKPKRGDSLHHCVVGQRSLAASKFDSKRFHRPNAQSTVIALSHFNLNWILISTTIGSRMPIVIVLNFIIIYRLRRRSHNGVRGPVRTSALEHFECCVYVWSVDHCTRKCIRFICNSRCVLRGASTCQTVQSITLRHVPKRRMANGEIALSIVSAILLRNIRPMLEYELHLRPLEPWSIRMDAGITGHCIALR